ncbi:YciI family protein [Devosia sp. SL43]|uniref:YciI family protein n=1 Tax=Devosia sp. SL43 TaxID=2806348 RepID=UPI001F3481A8|nr:YciI family protein [Devosia sp. SL43]UJW87086.1 YciI family protein [Devosia sp. SL43]
MLYLCIVYAEDGPNPLTPSEETAIKDAFIEQDHKLFREGKVIMASPLQGRETAANIRYPNGVRSRTDGPYAETKEYVAGFLVISAANMDEAIATAVEGPFEGFASFEIRPLLDEKHSQTGQDRSFFWPRA